ncbi:MAG: hypothetical protein ABSA92_15325 [Candidatus Bathyarchaeia archaeon]
MRDGLSLRLIRALLICALVISAADSTLILVQSEPAISLSVSGRNVSFTGAGFLPTDTTCYVSSPSSNVILSSACVVQGGTGVPYGGFTIGNVLSGAYVIQVTGNYGDFAQAIVQVDGGAPQFSQSHLAGYQAGSSVSIQVSGLLPTDTTCQLSSPSSPNVILPGTAACVILAGGAAYGGFTVGNVLPGEYVIRVTGNQGDFAQTVLTVG